MKKTIKIRLGNGYRVLVYSPTDHGYIDPEDHRGMDGFGGSRTVWRFKRRKKIIRRPRIGKEK